MKEFAGKHILIIVENLPVPFDRRVWQEANALKDNGADVSIICPKMKGYNTSRESLNGIEIYRHPLPIEGSSAMGFALEYSIAIFYQFFYTLKIFLKKKIHVIHGCNPPDLIFLTALFFKLFGVRFVFDHHDANPEFYYSKFLRKDFFWKLMFFLERLTFLTANYSIATNDSYKRIAIQRGKMNSSKVKVVRSGPDLSRLIIQPPIEKYKKKRKFLVGYLGVIGESEGIDLLLNSVKEITSKRDDVQFAIVGGGTYLKELEKLSLELNVNNFVDFYGRVDDQTLLDILNTSDVCVNPDRPTEMNDISTMNKIMEYMALKKPIVQFDLKEGRISAQEASLYAENNSVEDFSEKIIWLLDNPKERRRMGEFGYARVKNELNWDFEKDKLLDHYTTILLK